MEKRFEYKIKEPKYPKLEDLVDVEMPENVKSEIAGLVFEGLSEEIADLLQDGKNKGLIKTEEYQDFIIDKVVRDVKYQQNIKVVYTAIISYLDRSIMSILKEKVKEKVTESLKRTTGNKSEMQEITDWCNKVIREAGELPKKWLPEIMALAWEYEIKMNRENGSKIKLKFS